MAYTNTQLCQLNGGCIGCCGHDYPSADAVDIAIQKNTLEFKDFKKAGKSLKQFRDRADRHDLRSGLCRNAIRFRSKLVCGIHPALGKSQRDLRKGHCDIRYLCKSAKTYNNWDTTDRKKFAAFTKQKRATMTQAQYSLAMDADEFLKEFEK